MNAGVAVRAPLEGAFDRPPPIIAKDIRTYCNGVLAAVGAVPSVVNRITPDGSVKNPRWPVVPTVIGSAVMVYAFTSGAAQPGPAVVTAVPGT